MIKLAGQSPGLVRQPVGLMAWLKRTEAAMTRRSCVQCLKSKFY